MKSPVTKTEAVYRELAKLKAALNKPGYSNHMFDVRRTERLARATGASGFVSKQDGPEKMIATIYELLNGGET
jgi:DNA-binding NarL/FixJ family response regulator